MPAGARTPEELEALFEDAYLLRDDRALVELFEARATLAVDGGVRVARGGAEISRLARELWQHNVVYVSDPERVLQAHDTALVLAPGGINVAHRGRDGTWRYAISVRGLDGAR